MEDQAFRRRYIRSDPDSGDFVKIDRDAERTTFEFQEVALLVEESPMGGFGIACLRSLGLKVGGVHRFAVGKMAPLKAEIVWERALDEKIVRFGLRFLE